MADEDIALTTKQKVHGAILMLIMPAAMAGILLLLSWIVHSDLLAAHPAPATKGSKPGAHGKPAVSAKKAPQDLPVQSPWFWVLMACSLGLAALPPMAAFGVGFGLGFLYTAEAAILASYDLENPLHYLYLVVDWTWSLPNTILGLVAGTPLYMIFGKFSRRLSAGGAWVSFDGNFGSVAKGTAVYQTLGTLNLGGAQDHERAHLLQARLLGPVYLPLQIASYIVNGLIQILFTCTLGWILRVTGVRDSAWFRPGSDSAVQSGGAGEFFGWIYRYTILEIWGYAQKNP